MTNSPSRRIDVTRLPLISDLSSRQSRSDSGDIHSVMVAMKTATASEAISTGFSIHHCLVPAALMTTSSDPWFSELKVKMTASINAIGAVTVVSEGRRRSVIWKNVMMV